MQRSRWVQFTVVFAALVCGALLTLQGAWSAPVLWRLKTQTAEVVAALVSTLGTAAIADGAHVRFAGTWIHIIDECTGIYAMILLGSFVLAFPGTRRWRVVALAVCVLAVSALNILRLVTLALLMVHAPDAADFAHDYLWQVLWAGALVLFASRAIRPEPSTT